MARKKIPFEQAYITPQERKQRVLTMLSQNDYENLNQLAQATGMSLSHTQRALLAPHTSVVTICKIAHALGCTVNYLTEK